jgi:hypothetical protein
MAGWPTSRCEVYLDLPKRKTLKTGGAPLLALFEKWASKTADTVVVLVLRSRRSNLHLQHAPFIDFHCPSLAQEVGAETAPGPELR